LIIILIDFHHFDNRRNGFLPVFLLEQGKNRLTKY
jgi:hypothetical protein